MAKFIKCEYKASDKQTRQFYLRADRISQVDKANEKFCLVSLADDCSGDNDFRVSESAESFLARLEEALKDG